MIAREPALTALTSLLPPGRVVTDPVALLTYEGDASLDRGLPDAVVLPQTTEEVARLVAWASRYRIPLVARGAGTGLSGGAVAEHGGVIVAFARMERLVDLDPVGRSAVVEPGLTNLLLDTVTREHGLYFPPDPSSGRASTLGGNLAENAGGPHCFKYGVTSNYVTGLEAVLPDGRLVRLGGAALDYPEYDLAGLLVGSEGTLGLITSATVRLMRYPPAVKTMMAAFDSVETAGEAVSAVIARGLVPATMEMMNQAMMEIIEAFVPAGLPTTAGAALIIEADGYPESVGLQIDEIAAILREYGGFNLRIAQSSEERDRIWYGRKSAAGAMARLAPAFYLVDGTVPRSKLAATLGGVNAICARAGLEVAYVFHAGDGNLHPFIPLKNPNDPALVRQVIEVGREILELCVGYGGSITGEHGVGIEKRAFMPMMYTADELAVMREIRDLFDPQAICNPGKIFPPASPTPAPVPPVDHPALTATPEDALAPTTAAEAAAILHALTATGRSVRLVGGDSHASSPGSAEVTVSSRGLAGITTYARDDLYVVAGAGTPLATLQAELAQDGMWVPLVSPWPEATLGGIVATNFNAPLRMRYGGVRDLLLATTVALPDGRVIGAGRPVVKNVAGYDLPKLYVGSHGTLGMLTDVTLKLSPRPRASVTLRASFASLADALAAGARLLPLCLVASALLIVAEPGSTALVYTAEGYPEDVQAESAQVQGLLAGATALETLTETTGSAQWAAWLAASQARITLRLGLPSQRLPEVTRLAAPTSAGLLADLANGLLYVRDPAQPSALAQAARQAGGYAVSVPGCLPPPADLALQGYVSEARAIQQALQNHFGAGGLLNPGIWS
ncbi:FAD-binding oxidoreductase [Candidatus Chloroploca sp. Khr17]|uniref:FAD-binding oxidoreductase n=1 Tax=Candidatus Chloroploca sp. Khr17 TaxID=2496869 RepID=UPI00101D8DD4|nr:FAD-linked oxidase C-terminal domain-containing protein [Candidatus Chloroploca sp. Khr17]